MIDIRDLRVTFNRGTPIEMTALRGCSLTIPEGQFLTVIGTNGAGKTTVLNAIAGDVNADSGKILIGDQDVTRWSRPRRAALIGRVFQDPVMGSCADLTIEENMSLASKRGARRGFGLAIERKRRERFKDHLSLLGLGLENRLQDRVGLLSGGQRQAVNLLMATLSPMKVLLLDEHTAALDPKTAEFVLALTRKVVEQFHLTTMMVTHSMRHALDLGDRTVMLHEGRVVADIEGEERRNLDVADLLLYFTKHRGQAIIDSLILG
jgi:putative tryptophan/tyrosine transport system ATP-binding protein